jgi:hypothetical protein
VPERGRIHPHELGATVVEDGRHERPEGPVTTQVSERVGERRGIAAVVVVHDVDEFRADLREPKVSGARDEGPPLGADDPEPESRKILDPDTGFSGVVHDDDLREWNARVRDETREQGHQLRSALVGRDHDRAREVVGPPPVSPLKRRNLRKMGPLASRGRGRPPSGDGDQAYDGGTAEDAGRH